MRLSALVRACDAALIPVGAMAAPRIRDVITTDLLDPSRYLRGGELVLTGLAWWRPDEPARTARFVAALVRARVAALAAGEAELGTIPDDLIAECAAAGLPLLRVPVEVSFSTITERAGRHLAAYRGGDLAALIARRRSLAERAAGLVTRAGAADHAVDHAVDLTGILNLVAADLGLTCTVLTSVGRVVAGSPIIDDRERRAVVRRFLGAAHLPVRIRRPAAGAGAAAGRAMRVYGIGVASVTSRLDAWLLAIDDDQSDTDLVSSNVIDELVALIDIERAADQRNAVASAALASRLLATITGSDPEAGTAAALRRRRLEPGPYIVVVGHGDHALCLLRETYGLEQGGVSVAAGVSAANGLPAAVGVVDVGIGGGVVGGSVVGSAEVVRRLRAVLDLVGPSLRGHRLAFGVSDPVSGVDGLVAATAQAHAVALTARPGVGHTVAGPERLASHALLLAALPGDLRRAYRRRVLGALLDHDRAHRGDLVGTLTAYLDCSGSWAECASRLHVHVNTLRYRMSRVAALTGRDPRKLEDQVDLLVALRMPDD